MNKTGVIAGLAFALTLIITITAFASEYIYTQGGRELAGITFAYPQKRIKITPVVGSTKWTGVMKSFTDNPVYVIDRIGWNWWTRREWCGNTIVYSYQSNGAVEYQSSSISSNASHSLHLCTTGDRKVSVIGKHDFTEAGDVHQPTWETGLVSAP